MTSVLTRILATLSAQPDRTFLVGDDGPVARGEALAFIARRQHQLLAAGIGAGDRVLVAGGRGPVYWLDMLAVWGIGAVFVPVGIGTPPEHVEAIIRIVEPRACTGAAPHLTLLPAGIVMLDPPGEDHAASPLDLTRPEALAAISFTSGSTGLPKGVALTHATLLGNALSSLEALAPAGDDRIFVPIPFNFISAISHFLVMALAGAEICATEKRLMMADLYRAIAEARANCFGGSPLQLRWIADCAVSGQPLGLRWVMGSGDHLSVRTIDALRQNLPDTRIFTVYGLTELGGRFCFLDPRLIETQKGKVGRPIRGLAVRVLDEDGAPVPPGEIGEVFVAGDFMLREYYGNPDATAHALTPAGFRTGDLGRLDEDGLLSLVGRADDVFKCHGEKVSALPIADALMETGLFLDVAVVAHDDPHLGTIPKVLYVPRPEATIDKAALGRALRTRLPVSHVPRAFAEVASIPRTGSGKIKRVELRALALTV